MKERLNPNGRINIHWRCRRGRGDAAMGEWIFGGTITKWLKKVGEKVPRDAV
jgi:hypothetical protein